MIPGFMIHLGAIYSAIAKSNKLPKEVSYRIPYAQVDSWYKDRYNWCCMQWHNAKHVYLYSIELQLSERTRIAVDINHPDTHWQYALQGGYSLVGPDGAIPVLEEGCKHLLRGAPGHLQVDVDAGRHWIVGFHVAASWLGRYPEELAIDEQHISRELQHGILYQSAPTAISELDRAELYYLLGLGPSRHILQDSQIYLPISKLVEQMQTPDDTALSPVQNKVQAVRYYITQLIDTDQAIPSISALADRFGIDKNYLGRRHQLLHGESLATYIFDQKQDRALVLLAKKKPISDISHLLGYSHSSAFRKAFIKKHGICPSEYRRRST